MFLIAAAGLIWQSSHSVRRRIVITVCVLIIGCANLVSTIWPRHSRVNPRITTAKCFVDHTTVVDLFVITDWSWFDYSRYFFGYKGGFLSLVGKPIGESELAHLIDGSVKEVHDKGGHVYMADLSTYTAEQWKLTETLTGISRGIFERMDKQPAFECEGLRFVELMSRQGGARVRLE